jgi:hypothetical protein
MKERQLISSALSQRFDLFRRYPGIAVSGNALDQRPLLCLAPAGIMIRISVCVERRSRQRDLAIPRVRSFRIKC